MSTVVYVGAVGRSGSTILDRSLVGSDGISLGEIRWLLTRGIEANEPCSCGELFGDCSFWSSVVKHAVDGGLTPDLIERARRGQHRFDHDASYFLWPALRLFWRSDFDAWIEALKLLYEAIDAEAADRTVVDSSKAATYLRALRHAGVTPALVHLTRDPRAVAFSWSRTREYVPGSGRFIPRMPAWRSASFWMLRNSQLLLQRPARRRLLRYEDLCEDPTETLKELCADLDIGMPSGRAQNHQFAGNPVRFGSREEPRPLRIDNEWTRSMRRRDRVLVSIMCWPLERRFRYPLSAGRTDR